MHQLTVADVLALPVLAAGRHRVVVGESQLDRPVRWVHVTELTDPASFLKGGELVLTTGVPLPKHSSEVRRYVDELEQAVLPPAARATERAVLRQFLTRLRDMGVLEFRAPVRQRRQAWRRGFSADRVGQVDGGHLDVYRRATGALADADLDVLWSAVEQALRPLGWTLSNASLNRLHYAMDDQTQRCRKSDTTAASTS